MSITMTLHDVSLSFADLCNRVIYGRERVIIATGPGRVALVPAEDIELLDEIEDKADALAADAALKETQQTNVTVSWEELKAELKL